MTTTNKPQRIRVSPSLLEEWRVVSLGLYGAGPDRLEDKILGEFKTNPAISRGKAYHRMLEEGPEKFRKGARYVVPEEELGRDWIFEEKAVLPVYDVRELYAGGVHEVWCRWTCEIAGLQIVSNQRADMMDGLELHEFKTTGRAKKYHDYFDSMQWRLYLLGNPEAESITYHCFHLGKNNDWCRYTPFRMERFEELEQSVRIQLAGLLHWLKRRPDLLAALQTT